MHFHRENHRKHEKKKLVSNSRTDKMALHSAVKGKLISVIGDEDTCVGFLLGGVGEINKNRHPNFMVVDKSEYSCHSSPSANI